MIGEAALGIMHLGESSQSVSWHQQGCFKNWQEPVLEMARGEGRIGKSWDVGVPDGHAEVWHCSPLTTLMHAWLPGLGMQWPRSDLPPEPSRHCMHLSADRGLSKVRGRGPDEHDGRLSRQR